MREILSALLVLGAAVAPAAAAATAPDLVVTSVTGPALTGTLQTFSVDVTVANVGDAEAPATTLGLALVSVQTGQPFQLGGLPVGALAAGAAQSVTASYTVHWTTVAGEYFVRATADAAAAPWGLAEADETNNVASSARFPVHRPDLHATAVTYPPSAFVGASLPVDMTVVNQDLGDARPFSGVIVLTRDGHVCRPVRYCDEADDDWWTGAVRFASGLAGGLTTSASGSIAIPADLPAGTWDVMLLLDDADEVRESDETDNVRNLGTISILPPSPDPLPDLVVTSVTGPSSSGTLAEYTVTATVRNVGPVSAPYTSLAFTLVPLYAGGTPLALGGHHVPALAPGASHTVTATYTMHWTTVNGSYLIRATADAAAAPWAVAELDEANNVLDSAPFPVFRPDLFVTAVEYPASAAPGTSAPVQMSIVNQDQGGARPFRAQLVLTRDGYVCQPVRHCDEIDDDWWLGTVSVPDGLAGGAQVTATGSLVLPADFPAGTWDVLLVLDADGEVRESNEDDNDRFLGTITVP